MIEQRYYTSSRKQPFRNNLFKILKEKIVVQIFSQFKFYERQRLREVCYTWKTIIDQHFGFRVQNWKCLQPTTESLIAIFEVELKDRRWINGDSNLHVLLPILRHNRNLRTLIVDLRTLPSSSVTNPKVEHSCSDISLPPNSNRNRNDAKGLCEKTLVLIDQQVWLPRLKKCRIICCSNHGDEDDDHENWQQVQTVYLLFHLLQNSPVQHLDFQANGTSWELPLEIIFRIAIPRVNIYSQDVDSNFLQNEHGYYGQKILKLVPVHLLLRTLKSLKFSNDYNISLHFLLFSERAMMNVYTNTTTIARRKRVVTDSCFLESISFRIGSGKKWLSKGWTRILLAQSQLSELDYEMHRENEMRKHVKSILSNNYKSLRILKLYGTSKSCYGMDSFDGAWFHGLVNLEQLELVGESSEEKIYLKNLLPMLIRPWNLPHSLKNLVIHGSIDCGKVSPGSAFQHLTCLENLEMLGRFQSPWFYSDWDPIYKIDSNFIQNFHSFLPRLRIWKLIYLKPHGNRYKNNNSQQSIATQAFVKQDKNSWRESYYFYTSQTNVVDTRKKEIMCTKIKIYNGYEYDSDL